jgi:hypothetical protein
LIASPFSSTPPLSDTKSSVQRMPRDRSSSRSEQVQRTRVSQLLTRKDIRLRERTL